MNDNEDVKTLFNSDDYSSYCNEKKIDNIVGEKKVSILKIIMGLLLIVLFISTIYCFLVDSNNNIVEGTWKCTDYNGNYTDNDYYFEIDLDSNDTFHQNNYYDSKKNISGIYTYEELSDVYEGVTSIIDVFLTTNNSSNKYQFRLLDKDSSLVINTQSYSTYLCRKF